MLLLSLGQLMIHQLEVQDEERTVVKVCIFFWVSSLKLDNLGD